MRLKSLEIKGFKSFADKTIVNFDEGITGIIGPNGCGKSNIVDSIRWVIGEQKISNLRSENLESLVFNGSKTRSASGLAEVSLTFENTRNLLPTEFSTVTITRRFYKNGDSEYRLNDVQCRLKDIHNLFMDTGISTDSYAIIELGMVDDIIRDKENSRRRMLEQAAGISIYKIRKKEAKSKLEATDQDLARIEDLLFEINNQLKSLENQAKKAEKYYEIKKDYKVISIELAKVSLQGFNIQYKLLNEQQIAETDKKVGLEVGIATEEAALEIERTGFIEEEKQLQAKQQAFNALVQTLKQCENDKNLASQQMQFLQEKEESLRDFLDKSSGQLQSLEDSVQYTLQQQQNEVGNLATLTAQLQEHQQTLHQKRQVFDGQRKQLDTARNQLQAIQRQQFDSEKAAAVADTGLMNLKRTLQQLQEEQLQRRDQMATVQREREERELDLGDKKAALADFQEKHEIAKEKILASQQELEQLRSSLVAANRQLDQKRNEFDLLKSLIDSMEGYPESVKFLHNNPKWNCQAPILSDIIYVHENYRAAVEQVLEPYLNYYVVRNVSEAMEAVHLLDAGKKGKAHFFLLDKIDAFEQVTPAQPILDTTAALSVIEVDDKYHKLAAYLLGNVLIAESEITAPTEGAIVLLEKSGKLVQGTFTLSGGSNGLFEGKKIGRAKNLEKLKEEITSKEAVVNELTTSISLQQNEIAAHKEQLQEQAIKTTEQQISQLTNQVFASQNKYENLQLTQTNAFAKIAQYEDQLADVQDEIAEIREQLANHSAALEDLLIAISAEEQAYKAAELDYQQASGKYNECNLQLTRQQSQIATLEQELAFRQQQVQTLQQQMDESKVQQFKTSTQMTENIQQLEKATQALVGLLRRKEADEKQLNEADQAYYIHRNAIQERETALRQQLKIKEAVDQLLEKVKDELNQLKLRLAGMKERLAVEFKINIDDIFDQPRESDTSLEDLQASVDRMKKRLEHLGEINPTAIEAYTEMKKRYEFILEQKNDLVNARESLLQTIQEVESTANQQFLDTFHAVRENFQRVFKALFTEEDTADLILENPHDLAETGIDIVAKPKGKRPSSITQLSGGEKTLTATALLFSIYLIKPAPFCILDEVDAPLDDANVGKFTQMIRKFSENSQFIIVTHNKQTMSCVDVIYGVTMQEAGVSKLVPVDFRSLD